MLCARAADNKSKFGTTLQGEKLPENTPTPLADGQDLRLGYKSKFRLVWQAAPLLHCPHPLPEPPAAAISSLFAQAGASAAPWGPQVTHVLAAEGQPLSAAVLCAALQEVAVVGVSWLQALTSKTAWRAALPSVEEHRVSKFTYLSSSGTKGQQQQQHKLDLAAWAAAGSGNLLQGFSILVDVGQVGLVHLHACSVAAFACAVQRHCLSVHTSCCHCIASPNRMTTSPCCDVLVLCTTWPC